MRVLVLCVGNSCRSPMALGWIRSLCGDGVEAHSAGSRPAERVHPLAIRVMAEVGIDISAEKPQPLDRFLGQPFDRVVTVCDSAAETCPVFPGSATRYHRDFVDPALATGSEDQRMVVFRQVRDDISAWIAAIMSETP